MKAPALGLVDHAVVGNGRSCALVAKGSIDWLCWPRFDSPSLFAGVLDPDRGGDFTIAPTQPCRVTQRYLDRTAVLETLFECAAGRVRLLDFMPVRNEEQRLERLAPEHELVRIVECEVGQVEMEVRFRPRPDYGRERARLTDRGALGLRLEDGRGLYTLRGEEPLHLEDETTARARFQLRAKVRRTFSLSFDAEGPAVLPPLGMHARESLRESVEWWKEFANRCTYDGPYREQVVRSAVTLKLLQHAPSGAIIAAPTTSLPERPGGDLNWDYRFCWLRDASLTTRALADLGYHREADAFVSWMLHATHLSVPKLQALYDVYGVNPPKEESLRHLQGHLGSRPVRINNAAANQLQLDGYGAVIDAVSEMCRHGMPLDSDTRRFLRDLGTFVMKHWRDPDHGIWERRDGKHLHTHSIAMCWVAMDRLLELHEHCGLTGIDAAAMHRERQACRDEVEARGYSPRLDAYVRTFDGHELDCSLLQLALYRYAPASSPRLRNTFARIVERLELMPCVFARDEQARRDGEGGFAACGFWVADFLARGGGALQQAERCFEKLLAFANPVGLYGEEIDPKTRHPLGNFPQAYSHVGLISAAVALEARRVGEKRGDVFQPRMPEVA